MHQSLCNLPITSLIKAINIGFLNSTPHLNVKSVQKYLALSPTTSKGHMKHPRKGIRSTTPKPTRHNHLQVHLAPIPAPINQYQPMPGLIFNDDDNETSWPTLITDVDDESIANWVFLAPLPTKTQVSYTTTAQAFPPSCHLTTT